MRIFFLGDIMGRAGRSAVCSRLPVLKRELRADFVVANAENASHGFGLTPQMADDFYSAGVDVITLGNHAWDRKDIIPYIQETPLLLRPLNMPEETPGQGFCLKTLADGRRVAVVTLIGRLFMDTAECPFRKLDEFLNFHRLNENVDAVITDFHAEATSEKMALGHFADGRVSLLVGTHTHCPSADTQILPGGTAYQSEAGMCGDFNSVIGMKKEAAISRFLKRVPQPHLAPAEGGEATLCGILVETDDQTGLALRAEPFRIGGRLLPHYPAF